MTFWTPLELLDWLEKNGYRLKVKDGRLVGPPGLDPAIIASVKEHKASLVTLITYQCPQCNQPIREAVNTPNVLYVECVSDPLHFSYHIPRKRGLPSFITTGGWKPEKCVECGKPNDGEWKFCSLCWLALFEADECAA